MKNPTSGDLGVMLNSIYAGQHAHDFIFREWEVKSDGNPYTHAILRGSQSKHGQIVPNYHYEDLKLLYDLYMKKDLVYPAVVVDTNHCNSAKKYRSSCGSPRKSCTPESILRSSLVSSRDLW